MLADSRVGEVVKCIGLTQRRRNTKARRGNQLLDLEGWFWYRATASRLDYAPGRPPVR